MNRSIITLNIWLIPMVKLKARLVDGCNGKQESTTRTTWMANNAIPDSIIMNMICLNLVPGPPNEPQVRSTEARLISKNTLRILSTITPVTRVFTAREMAKLIIINGSKGRYDPYGIKFKLTPMDPSAHLSMDQTPLSFNLLKLNVIWESDPSQAARRRKFEIRLLDEESLKIDYTDLCMRLLRMKE